MISFAFSLVALVAGLIGWALRGFHEADTVKAAGLCTCHTCPVHGCRRRDRHMHTLAAPGEPSLTMRTEIVA